MDGVRDIRATQNVAQAEASQRLHAEAEGIIPPYVLTELSKRDPGNTSYSHTLEQMNKNQKEASQKPQPRFGRSDNAAREVYDAGGEKLEPGEHGEKARFEGEAPTGDRDVDTVYDYTGNVRQFYKEVFGRNSIDDNGMKFVSRVNYGQNFQNAYWDGTEMTYGKPDASSPFRTFVLQDVTGHEITHGVSQYESNLGHYGQAGALNESMSDVFGELVNQWAHHEKATDSHWLIGEGIWKSSINGRGLRDMLHPGTAYNDKKIGKDPQGADMDHYVQTTKDNGGVHVNCGIPNKAFAEFATAIGGYAWEEAGHVWYQARQDAGSNPSFAQFAEATIEAAQKLGFEGDVAKLEHAWADVGVTPSATERDDLTPAREDEDTLARDNQAKTNAAEQAKNGTKAA